MGGRGGSFGGSSGYHVFGDSASGSHTYSGDGADVVDFFNNNSNYNELIGSMTKNERDDFHSWSSGYMMLGQQYEGWDNMSRDDQAATKTYDKFLDQAELKEGIIVARRSDAQLVLGKGTRYGSIDDFRAAEGSRILCKGNMSCGAAKEGLTIGSSRKSVEYKIHIPKGKGAGMWIGDKRINGWGAMQREFMTNRDAVFRVGKTTERNGIYHVDLYYEGHTAHDYGKKGRK